MYNKIKVYNENGILEEVEVIDFFFFFEYDHEYVLYTKNEEVDNNIVIYVSIVNQISNDEYQFETITDPEEERKVDEMIDKEIDLLTNE